MLDRGDSTHFVPALTFAKRVITLTCYATQTDQTTAELMLNFIGRQLNDNPEAEQRLNLYSQYVDLYLSNPKVYQKLDGPTHNLVREAGFYAQEQYQPMKRSTNRA